MTAVEWLLNELQEVHRNYRGLDVNWLKRFENAKAMEQNQIIRAVNHSIMKLDEMRAEAIKQNITIGELYIKINKDEKVL